MNAAELVGVIEAAVAEWETTHDGLIIGPRPPFMLGVAQAVLSQRQAEFDRVKQGLALLDRRLSELIVVGETVSAAQSRYTAALEAKVAELEAQLG